MFADHLRCIQECSRGLQNCNMVASRLDIGDMWDRAGFYGGSIRII